MTTTNSGWNRAKTGTEKEPRKVPTVRRGLVAGALVAGAAILVLLFVFRGDEVTGKEVAKRESALIRDVSGAKPPAVQEPVVEKRRVITREEQAKLRPGDEGFDPAAHPFVLVITNKVEEVEDKHPVARNATEQILHWICSTPVGEPPVMCPDLPSMEVSEIEKILDQGADYQHDESLDRLEAKQAIEVARQELKEYISKGGKPEEFFKYYHYQLMHYYEERMDAQNAVMKTIKNEDPEFARDYYEAVNKKLSEKGIKTITLSRKMRERLGIPESGKQGENK